MFFFFIFQISDLSKDSSFRQVVCLTVPIPSSLCQLPLPQRCPNIFHVLWQCCVKCNLTGIFKTVQSFTVGMGVTCADCLQHSVQSSTLYAHAKNGVECSGFTGGPLLGPFWPFQYKQTNKTQDVRRTASAVCITETRHSCLGFVPQYKVNLRKFPHKRQRTSTGES